MKLHVDLETFGLIEAPGFRNPVTTIRFKRGDAAKLEVFFLRNGTTPETIGNPATLELTFGVKPRGRYDLGYLAESSDWVMPTPNAANPKYECSPSFNTVELNNALGVGTSNELEEITLMGEITWRVGSGEPTSTRTFLVVVENDVIRGTEGTPLALPTPEEWLSAQIAGGVADARYGLKNGSNIEPEVTASAVGKVLIKALQSLHPPTSGVFHFSTTRSSQASFTVKTTSGHARLINANGSLGAVVAAVNGTITLTIPAAGGHRAYGVISTTSTGVTLGMFEEISLVSKQLTAISVTSLSFLKQLILDNNYLTEIDATGLGFLNFLHVGDNRLTRFAGTGLSQLDTLLLHNNQIAQFSGAGMGNLTYLGLASNQLVSFSGTGMGSLQSLDLSGNMLANFPSAGLGNLQELNLANNQLAAFSGAGLGLLTILNLANNKLTGFSNTGLGGLTNLNLSDNEIPTFSGVGYANLVVLNLSWNKLIILSSEGLESLKQLDLSGNNLGTFSGAGFGSLTHLILDATKLTSISLAGLPLLKTVSMRQHYFSQAAHDAAFNSLPAAANGNIGYWDSTWDPTDSFLPSAASEAKRTAMTAGGWTLVFGPL